MNKDISVQFYLELQAATAMDKIDGGLKKINHKSNIRRTVPSGYRRHIYIVTAGAASPIGRHYACGHRGDTIQRQFMVVVEHIASGPVSTVKYNLHY